jgi:hypothetical protein
LFALLHINSAVWHHAASEILEVIAEKLSAGLLQSLTLSKSNSGVTFAGSILG